MKKVVLRRSFAGKVGTVICGPKRFLNTDILIGEATVCIAREMDLHAYPSIWAIGGFDQLDDFLFKANKASILPKDDLDIIWARLESIKRVVAPPLQRLSAILGYELSELQELCKLAQVSVSSPIQGVRDFASGKPRWLPKQGV